MKTDPNIYKNNMVALAARYPDLALMLSLVEIGQKYQLAQQPGCLPNILINGAFYYVGNLQQYCEEQFKGFAKMINAGEIGPDLVTRPQIPEGCEFAYSDIHKEYVDYLVIGPYDVNFYECYARYGVSKSEDVALAECVRCGHWYFVGMSGSYQCRFCNMWDGNNLFNDLRYLSYKDGLIGIGYTLKTVKDFIQEAAR